MKKRAVAEEQSEMKFWDELNLPVSVFKPGIAVAIAKHARPSFCMLSGVIGPNVGALDG